MDPDLAQEAIYAATNEDWKKAINLNTTIIKSNPTDIDAMNRLARAYAQMGNTAKAKLITQKVLKIDPKNSIANKCQGKWDHFTTCTNEIKPCKNFVKIFIQEPSKTKIITLVNLATSQTLTGLSCGDSVKIDAKLHKISILSTNGKYIGKIPDNVAYKLLSLIKLGTKFEGVIESASRQEVKILIHH
jgi:tetratricopeptide (TPR) repeat protein